MDSKSELSVITKSKDLCNYILTITDKSPKKFRFTLVSRLQNYSLAIIENLLSANEVRVLVDTMEKRFLIFPQRERQVLKINQILRNHLPIL